MKNYFAKNFFRNLRMCELLANGIVKDFLYHVYALQYLRNIGRTGEIVLVSYLSTMIVHQQ